MAATCFLYHDAAMFCVNFTTIEHLITTKIHNSHTDFVWTSTLDYCYTLCKMMEEISTFAKIRSQCTHKDFSHTSVLELVLQCIGHRKPPHLPSWSSSSPHHLKLSAEDHTSQLDGVLDQVRNLLDMLKTLQDTLEGWRSKLKDHEPPHVLPKDVEAQLQELAVSKCGDIRCYHTTMWWLSSWGRAWASSTLTY